MKINVKKFLSVGSIILAVSVIATLVAFIMYNVNVGGTGYFHGVEGSGVVVCSVFAIICGLVALFLAMVEADGIVGKILNAVQSVLVIVMAILLMIAFVNFIGSRVEGLAYIYGSDANIQAEVQTPENMASASGAIAGVIVYVVAWLITVVASFFNYGRKAQEPVEAAA